MDQNNLSNDPKPWQRPWTTQEMIDNASNWNLAGDAGLLLYLQQFSDDLVSRSNNVIDNLNSMFDSLTDTEISLRNVTNHFMGLHHTQFVESRVYEEDEMAITEEALSKAKQSTDDKVDQVDNLELMRQVVEKGLEVLNTQFEKVEVPNHNFDNNQSEAPSVVFRAKDPYSDRPLPYVIGSKEWYASDHVGLLKESHPNAGEKVVPQDKIPQSPSEIESEFDMLIKKSTEQGISDTIQPVSTSESHGITTFNPHKPMEPEKDMFGSSTESEPETTEASLRNENANARFAAELAAKLGNVSGESGVKSQPAAVQPKPKSTTSNRVTDNFFSDEPPPLDETDKSLFKPKSSEGGLFDDLDNDELLWGTTKPKLSENIGESGMKKKPIDDLFGDDEEDDDMFFKNKTEKEHPAKKPQKESRGLFDDSDSDDLFSSTNDFTSSKKSYLLPLPGKPIAPLISNEPPPIIDNSGKAEAKKKTAGAVRVLPGANESFVDSLNKVIKNRRQSSSDSEDQQSTLDDKKTKVEEVKQESKKTEDLFEASHVSKTISKKPLSLFSDEDENEDLIPQPALEKPKIDKIKQTSKKTDNLFDDAIVSKTGTIAKKTLSLFSDEDESDDLFENLKKDKPSYNQKQGKGVSTKSLSLFGNDDDSEDFIATKENKIKKSGSKDIVSSLFDDDDNDEDPFDFLNTKKSSLFEKKSNLFDETEDDIFSVKIKKPESETKDKPAKTDIFTDIKKVSKPNVDIFANIDPVKDIFENVEKSGVVVDTKQKNVSKKNIFENLDKTTETKPKIDIFTAPNIRQTVDIFTQNKNEQSTKTDIFANKDVTKTNIFEGATETAKETVSNQNISSLEKTPILESTNIKADSFLEDNKISENVKSASQSSPENTSAVDVSVCQPEQPKAIVSDQPYLDETPPKVNIFEESDKDDDDIFAEVNLPKKKPTVTVPTHNTIPKDSPNLPSLDKIENTKNAEASISNIPEDVINSPKPEEIKNLPTPTYHIGLFDSEPPDFEKPPAIDDKNYDTKSDTDSLFDYDDAADNEGPFVSSGIFDSEPPPIIAPTQQKTERKPIDLFDDSDLSKQLFNPVKELGTVQKKMPTMNEDLFSDEEDLFSTNYSKKPPTSKIEDNADLFGSHVETKQGNARKIKDDPDNIFKSFQKPTEAEIKKVTDVQKSKEDFEDPSILTSKSSSTDNSKPTIATKLRSDVQDNEDKLVSKPVLFEKPKTAKLVQTKENVTIQQENQSEKITVLERPTSFTTGLKSAVCKEDDDDNLFTVTKSDSPTKTGSPGKLKHSLSINVAALLPGATLSKTAIEKSVGFDVPTNIETLPSTQKDRIRIPVKRRPSSRRARQKAIRESGSDFVISPTDLESEISDNASPVEITNVEDEIQTDNQKGSLQTEPLPKSRATFSPSTDEDDIINIPSDTKEESPPLNESSLFGASALISPDEKSKSMFVIKDEDSDRKNVSKTETSIAENLFASPDSDLFGAKPKYNTNLFSSPEEGLFNTKPKMVKSEIASDDSLFKSKTKKEDEELFRQGNKTSQDDLFGSTIENPKKEERKQVVSIFSDEDDDIDIFASKSNIQQGRKKVVGVSQKTESVSQNKKVPSIFDDDNDSDDFFKPKKLSSAVKKASLFDDDGDDTDIFGTNQPSSSKKTVTTNVNKKPISVIKKPAQVSGEPVFDDPLMALKK